MCVWPIDFLEDLFAVEPLEESISLLQRTFVLKCFHILLQILESLYLPFEIFGMNAAFGYFQGKFLQPFFLLVNAEVPLHNRPQIQQDAMDILTCKLPDEAVRASCKGAPGYLPELRNELLAEHFGEPLTQSIEKVHECFCFLWSNIFVGELLQ